MSETSYKAFISYSHTDGTEIAEALQNALQRLAKPWYLKRTFPIFRDQTNLSASPHLWASIEEALSRSEHFILLASPQAAHSKWVDREVTFWLAHKGVDSLILVLTDGQLVWDEEKGDFDPALSTALPAALYAQYVGEPLYIDLSSFSKPEQLSLENLAFAQAVHPLAAKLHQKSVDELFGEIEKNHRQALLVRNGVIASLGTLLAIAVTAGFNFFEQKKIAEAEKDEANRRLSEVYWSYSRDSYSNGKHLRALHYASEAANLWPNRGYGVSFMNLTHALKPYLLQDIHASTAEISKTTEFKQDLESLESSRFGWSEMKDLSLLTDSGVAADGAMRHAESNIIVSWRDDVVTIRDGSTLQAHFEPIAFRYEVRTAWYWKRRELLVVRLYDNEERESIEEVWDVARSARVFSNAEVFGVPRLSRLYFVVRQHEGRKRHDPDWFSLSLKDLGSSKKKENTIRLTSEPRVIAWGGDFGKIAAVVTREQPRTVSFWSMRSGEKIGPDIHHLVAIAGIKISKDQRHVLVSGVDGTEHLWVRFQSRNQTNFDSPSYTDGVFGPTGQEFMLWAFGRVTLVDITKGTNTRVNLPTEIHVNHGRFSPDGRSVAIWGPEALEVWDKHTLKRRFSRPLGPQESSITFSPDGSYLIQVTERNARALRVDDGSETEFDVVHDTEITAITISDSGTLIAAGEKDGSVSIWNKNGSRVSPKSLRHDGAVRQCLFLENDRCLLCIGPDSRLWAIEGSNGPQPVLSLGDWRGGSVTADSTRLLLWAGRKAQLVELPSGTVLARNLVSRAPIIGGRSVSGGRLFRAWDVYGTINTWWAFSGSPLGELEPSGIVEPDTVIGSPEGDALLYFDYDEGRRTTYMSLAGGDEDFPEEWFRLQAQALTGTRINVETGNVTSIPASELKNLRRNYFQKLEAHAKACAFPIQNLYNYLSASWERDL